MIVDTSALVAIVMEEPEAPIFAQIIASNVCRISVASRVELAMVLENRGTANTERRTELFLHDLGIIEEPVTIQQGALARGAFYDFGKGRHRAGLNFGDCFSYALAKSMSEPLLYKGSDFAQTDVIPAYRGA